MPVFVAIIVIVLYLSMYVGIYIWADHMKEKRIQQAILIGNKLYCRVYVVENAEKKVVMTGYDYFHISEEESIGDEKLEFVYEKHKFYMHTAIISGRSCNLYFRPLGNNGVIKYKLTQEGKELRFEKEAA